MSTHDLISLVRSIYDAWNHRDFGRHLSRVADDIESTIMPFGVVFRGREGFLEFQRGWATPFPDGRVEPLHVLADEGTVLAESAFRATHAGPLSTPAGEIPPTGRKVELTFTEAWEFRDGQLVRHRNYVDGWRLMEQLGVLPLPGAERATHIDLSGARIGDQQAANKAVVRQLFDALNAGDLGQMLALVTDDIVIHTPVPGIESGREGFRGFMSIFFSAFPEQSVEVHEVIAEGDRVAVRHTHHATHGGEFMGLPPTGKRVTVEGIEIFRIRDGKVTEFWHQDDLLSLMQQLGAIPSPA